MRLAILAYPGALRMGIEGLREIFELANRYGGARLFTVRVFERPAQQRRALATFLGRTGSSSCMVIVPPGRLDALDDFKLGEVAAEVTHVHARGYTVAAICTGNFALAEAGVFRDRSATTHWGLERQFRARFPLVPLTLERILIDHGDVVSVGGLTAFIDFGLWLIAREAGRGLALLISRVLQVAPERKSQLPWMELALPARPDDPTLETLVQALHREPQRPWSTRRMAKLAGVTARTLERRFRASMGTSPARYLQERRLALARRHLEDGASVDQACASCGWSDLSSFVRLFKARTGFTPARYRAWTRGEGTRSAAVTDASALSSRRR